VGIRIKKEIGSASREPTIGLLKNNLLLANDQPPVNYVIYKIIFFNLFINQ
jgi:hypothetical protein